jgi:hypothetical protein
VRFAILEAAFPTMEHAWRASRAELIDGGLDARTATELVKARDSTDPDTEIDRLATAGVQALPRFASGYPEHGRRSATPRPCST